MAGDRKYKKREEMGHWAARSRGALRTILTILIIIVALPAAALFLLPTILSSMAPPLDLHQDLYAINRPIGFTFLDQDGDVVGRRGAVVGERLKLEEMPAYLPAAFIAMEDRTFYANQGFDMR